MSLAIRDTDVAAVLLADGWHQVKPDTFCVDTFEVISQGVLMHNGGAGFWFVPVEGGPVISGPMCSVLAVEVGE